MHEMHHILSLWHELRNTNESAVLGTVVQTVGSSYRLPGARLLVAKDGRHAGSISGGCLEEDLLKKAWWLTEQGPVLRRYDTRVDEDDREALAAEAADGAFGLGCNGVITILVERQKPSERGILDIASEVRAHRKSAIVAQSLTAPFERRWIRDTSGRVNHNFPSPFSESIAQLGSEQEEQEGARWAEVEGERFFIETLTPPVRLLIFGAGDDAIPLVRFAHILGWPVSVFDGRGHYARRDKFPEAEAVAVRPLGSVLPVAVDPWTAVILMSHSYSQDLDVLQQLIPYAPRYVAVLGPRKRTERLIRDAGAERRCADGHFHAPAGLDLGADGPEQVALAITAEIQAVFNGRSGGFLRDASGPIHARAQEPDSEFVVSGNPVCV